MIEMENTKVNSLLKKLAEKLEHYYKKCAFENGQIDASSIINANNKASEKYWEITDFLQSAIAPKYIHTLDLSEYVECQDAVNVEVAISKLCCLSFVDFFQILDEIDQKYITSRIAEILEEY